MHSPPLRSFLDFALEAAWQAGRITLGFFQSEITVEHKSDNSPVTVADRQAEARIIQLIQRYWPDHAILGEEFGEQGGGSGLQWIIDPIDGTRSFIAGVPLYATLIALVELETGVPLIGVAHFPALGETVYASQGGGCYWNSRPARVSTVSSLADALILASDLGTFGRVGKASAWQRMIGASKIQRTWGDAYGYALVATGRAEIMVDPAMSIWDCGPLQVIMEEAGGTFTDWEGTPTIFGGNSIATNGLLLEAVMNLVR